MTTMTEDRLCRCADEVRCELKAENERLREIVENDGKEIGSYREGTGLRGENQRLRALLQRMWDEFPYEESAELARQELYDDKARMAVRLINEETT